jgi:HK97 gp10 family phage protein
MGKRDFQIWFSVPEIGEALDKISAYDGKSALRIENAVRESTKNIKNGAKQRVPVRTGRLQKTITSGFNARNIQGYVRAGSYNGGWGGGAPYAHLVEFGARAAVVKPKNAKALKIGRPGAEAAGLKEFSGQVKISKRNEQPFMRPAVEDEKPDLIKNLKEAVQP